MSYFGEAKMRILEMMPEDEEEARPRHIELGSMSYVTPEDETDEPVLYSHPCWCNAELIYCDDDKGNEVWLHKRPQ